uniref:Uncharacterized protein n=1 Tax=Arundo donax TaxID=35708 RepID=A0A0A9B4E3_ARUDO
MREILTVCNMKWKSSLPSMTRGSIQFQL